MKKLFLTLAAFALVVPSAYALTLAEKEKLATWQKELAEDHYTKKFEENCGHPLEITLAEDVVTPFMEDNTSASAYCTEVIMSLSDLCEQSDIAKEAVSSKVKSITCASSGDADHSFALSETGELKFLMKPGIGNLADKAKEYLENNL